MDHLTMKRGDTHPALVSALSFGPGQPVVLTGATVQLVLRSWRGTAPVALTGATTITDAELGRVRHAWSPADTNRLGRYQVEWRVTFADASVQTFPGDGYQQVLLVPRLDDPVATQPDGLYATVAEARAAGAVGTDAEVVAALVAATTAVAQHTRELWAPTDLVLVASVGTDGTALLYRRVRSVTSVSVQGTSTELATTAYRVTSSADGPQGVDALQLGGQRWADPLIVGAEPWRGGWANLLGGLLGQARLLVTGSFGHDSPPPAVRQATALLAAQQLADPVAATDLQVDDEGNSLTITWPQLDPEQVPPHSTGSAAADQLLAPYVRSTVRWN